jgi:hypothetical protein
VRTPRDDLFGIAALQWQAAIQSAMGQARPPRADSKNLPARQMNAQNPDAVAATAPMITVCANNSPEQAQQTA